MLPPRKSWIQWRCTHVRPSLRQPGPQDGSTARPLADGGSLDAELAELRGQQALIGVPGVRGQQDGAPRPGRRPGLADHQAPPRSMRTAAMRSPAWPSQPGGPSPGRACAPASAPSSGRTKALRRDQSVGAGGQRDGTLGVRAQRQAGHVEHGGLLLDAPRIGDDGSRAADQREELDVARAGRPRTDRAPRPGRPRRACAARADASGSTMGRRRVASRRAPTSAAAAAGVSTLAGRCSVATP